MHHANRLNSIYLLTAMTLFGLFSFSSKSKPISTDPVPKSIYDIQIDALDGTPLDLHQFEGKKLLIVNVASKCGLTPQYKDLQELYDEYGDKLAIIGVPSNQFLGQEPGSSDEIATFCQKNYGVTFQMTEKVDVKGKNQHPLYQWLTSKELNNIEDTKVKWNFQKYIIDVDGSYLAMIGPKTLPLSENVLKHLR